jgi:hypothetical protein
MALIDRSIKRMRRHRRQLPRLSFVSAGDADRRCVISASAPTRWNSMLPTMCPKSRDPNAAANRRDHVISVRPSAPSSKLSVLAASRVERRQAASVEVHNFAVPSALADATRCVFAIGRGHDLRVSGQRARALLIDVPRRGFRPFADDEWLRVGSTRGTRSRPG